MGRIRVFLVLALAVTAGGVFAFGTYNYVNNLPKGSAPMPTQQVVVAANDLDVGAEITREDIRVIDWPKGSVPAQAITDPKDVIGRGLVLPVIQNEPILPMKLADKNAGGGLPPAIPPGLRALSVRVNEVIGVAGYVLPGTRVDVLATVNPGQNQSDITSKVILTNVQVLAAGTKIERDVHDNKAVPVSVVTLLVAPEEAERLTLASGEGKIQLALRNPLDKETPSTPGIRPAMLLGYNSATKAAQVRGRVVANAAGKTPQAAAASIPQEAAPAAATVEIIRGDKRAHEIVRQEQ